MTTTVEHTWSGTATGSSNVNTIDVSGITAGNLLVLCFNLSDAAYVVVSITDDGSGSWTELIDNTGPDDNAPSVRVGYKIASGTETTITVTLNATKNIYYKLLEISGCTSTPLDDYDYVISTSVSPMSLSATATSDGIAICPVSTGRWGYNTTDFSGLSGYSPDCTSINGVEMGIDIGVKTYTGAGSITASGTFTTDAISSALLLFLAAESGGGSTLLPTFCNKTRFITNNTLLRR